MIVKELLSVLKSNNIKAFKVNDIRYFSKQLPSTLLTKEIESVEIQTKTRLMTLNDIEHAISLPDELANYIESIQVESTFPSTAVCNDIEINIILRKEPTHG